jgi:hypothetical protein
LCLLLALLFLVPAAHAQEEHMFSYLPVKDVAASMLADFDPAAAPAGLEGLYALFADARTDASVYVFRMPNGRALLSVSCMEADEQLTTEVLWANRKSIAAGLLRSMEGQIAAEPEFRREELCGVETLTANIPLRTEDGTTLTTQAWLFCRGGDLLEIWTAHPSQLTYVFDQTADKELKSDLDALKLQLEGLDFGGPHAGAAPEAPQTESGLELMELEEADTTLPHMTITADDGTFRIAAPLDTMVIHAGTDAATAARARALFAERTGGGECFDLWYEEAVTENCWLLLSREYGIAAQISMNTSLTHAPLLSQLAALEKPIMHAMQESFDQVALADETVAIRLDGMEHIWFTYKLEKSGMELLTYVFTAADGTGLYELDIYLCCENDKSTDELSDMVILLMNSLDYLPETGV